MAGSELERALNTTALIRSKRLWISSALARDRPPASAH